MRKIAITKKSNTIFLATVLIVGTIAGISPSFIIGINAQTEPYNGMDERYSDYKQDYGMDSYDKKSYEPKPTPYGNDRDYGMDSDTKSYESNSYGSTDYRDNKDRKSYGSDSYKPQYPSYDKYDRDKSKDSSSKSVSINKIKCVNTNLNINGNNAGNVSIGNKGQGYLGAYGSDGNGGYDGGEEYSKQGKGFDCIINNNNTNNNIVAADGGGNATLAVTKTVTCIPNDNFGPAAEACQFILSNAPPSSFNIVITGNNPNPPEFLGSSVPVVVTLGAGDYEITEEVPIVSFPDGASITLTTNFAGDCRDVNPNNPQSTEATGTIQAGESQICDISNDYRTATLP